MEATKPQDGRKPPSGDITAAKHFPSLQKDRGSATPGSQDASAIRCSESPPSVPKPNVNG